MSGPPADLARALLLGLVGVIIFGITLPVTRIAVLELDPLFVTVGRGLIAAAMAAFLLAVRAPAAAARDLGGLVCSALGDDRLPLLMGTRDALCAGLARRCRAGGTAADHRARQHVVAGERPSPAFWVCSLAGTAAALTYAVVSSAGTMSCTGPICCSPAQLSRAPSAMRSAGT